MKYKVKNKFYDRTYYVFNNRQDAENAVLNLEDMYGIDYRDIYIEVEE